MTKNEGMNKKSNSCPCDSSQSFEDCCQPIISKAQKAETPEALMRSRYTAFCIKQMDHIKETTDIQVRSQIDFASNREWAENSEFLRLEILAATENGNKGTVEFKAHFKVTGEEQVQIHHEFSKFRKQQGVWFFREGRSLNTDQK